MSVSFTPIGPWSVVVVAALVVTILTIWAYQQRLKGTTGRWRWFALGLRLAAVFLCVLAAFRPSVIIQEKKKQPSSLIFLVDDSISMKIADELGGKARSTGANETLAKGLAATKSLGPNLQVKTYAFDSALHDIPKGEAAEPKGRSTEIGPVLLDAVKRQSGTRVASVVLLSDGANNGGINPDVVARQLRSQQVPIVTVGFGSESAGLNSRDVAFRDLVVGPTVFVKNQLVVNGSVVARGFPNKSIDVEMFVDDDKEPVARTKVKVPEGAESVPITGLKYLPQTPGEKKITLVAKPMDNELIQSNNTVSTFITVQAGGLNVLFLQGPHSPWEAKFLLRAIQASPDIHCQEFVLRKPAADGKEGLDDAQLAPGKYNAFILSDLPADHLTRTQQQLLTRAVENGAGLIMLGGRSSFGPGGWGETSLAQVLPIQMRRDDGLVEPEGGVKFVPNRTGLENYLFQVGSGQADNQQIWESMPPLTGTNRLGEPKLNATVLAQSPGANGEPLMVMMQPKSGRVLAFGGETWVWARESDASRSAHRKFWRQIIFWLSHKEDQGDNKIKLALDRRRISIGQKIEMTATARDPKNAPITNVTYEATVSREDAGGLPQKIDFFSEGEQARGAYAALDQPGTYKVTVTAFRDGRDIGRDSARFLVYQDDRELENPAADLGLLRQLAQTTGGAYVPSEELPKYLKDHLDGKVYSDYVTQTEHKVWDNWPFFLLFTTLLTLEWWLRKRHGWV